MSGIFRPEHIHGLPDAQRLESGARHDAPDSVLGGEAASAFVAGCADDALHFPLPAEKGEGLVPDGLNVWTSFAWSMECRSGENGFFPPDLPGTDPSGVDLPDTDVLGAGSGVVASRLGDIVSGDSLDVETLAGLLGDDSLDTGCGRAFVPRGMGGGVDANAVIDAGAETVSTGPDDAALLAHLFGM